MTDQERREALADLVEQKTAALATLLQEAGREVAQLLRMYTDAGEGGEDKSRFELTLTRHNKNEVWHRVQQELEVRPGTLHIEGNFDERLYLQGAGGSLKPLTLVFSNGTPNYGVTVRKCPWVSLHELTTTGVPGTYADPNTAAVVVQECEDVIIMGLECRETESDGLFLNHCGSVKMHNYQASRIGRNAWNMYVVRHLEVFGATFTGTNQHPKAIEGNHTGNKLMSVLSAAIQDLTVEDVFGPGLWLDEGNGYIWVNRFNMRKCTDRALKLEANKDPAIFQNGVVEDCGGFVEGRNHTRAAFRDVAGSRFTKSLIHLSGSPVPRLVPDRHKGGKYETQLGPWRWENVALDAGDESILTIRFGSGASYEAQQKMVCDWWQQSEFIETDFLTSQPLPFGIAGRGDNVAKTACG